MARLCSEHALAYVAACVSHVADHPRLSLERYRHAQIEAECGATDTALRLADAAVASLRISHGDDHDLTTEVTN